MNHKQNYFLPRLIYALSEFPMSCKNSSLFTGYFLHTILNKNVVGCGLDDIFISLSVLKSIAELLSKACLCPTQHFSIEVNYYHLNCVTIINILSIMKRVHCKIKTCHFDLHVHQNQTLRWGLH